jgi:CDP-diacylglycerol pyrophosphatase
MRRMRRPIWIVLVVVVGGIAATAFATFASGLDRLALWRVVETCVADFELTGAPFPCLEVSLSGGDERGDVVLRPPLLRDLIVAPTRRVVGVEDPYLQSPGAPPYFEAAWRARSFLEGPGGRTPERDEIALVANSALVRSQDQLHIHVGCLAPSFRRALAAAAPQAPIGEWARIGGVAPHAMLWGMRVKGPDLSGIHPFPLAARAFADKVGDRRNLTIAVAGVRVEGDDQFLILASYAQAPGPWLPLASSDLLDRSCASKSRASG